MPAHQVSEETSSRHLALRPFRATLNATFGRRTVRPKIGAIFTQLINQLPLCCGFAILLLNIKANNSQLLGQNRKQQLTNWLKQLTNWLMTDLEKVNYSSFQVARGVGTALR
jgi:hypothetical protein